MKVKIYHQGALISGNVKVAKSFLDNLVGFMFSQRPEDDYGILFETNSIQTTFMRFDLDLVFMNSSNTVIKVIRNMKPWRFTRFYFKAKNNLRGGSSGPSGSEFRKYESDC